MADRKTPDFSLLAELERLGCHYLIEVSGDGALLSVWHGDAAVVEAIGETRGADLAEVLDTAWEALLGAEAEHGPAAVAPARPGNPRTLVEALRQSLGCAAEGAE